MKFSFAKKVAGPAAELAALKSQLENARRRITDLTLENIQQANEISVLRDYRGARGRAPDAQARPGDRLSRRRQRRNRCFVQCRSGLTPRVVSYPAFLTPGLKLRR